MIVAFKVRESFSRAESYFALQNNCSAFAAEFADAPCEFFYYLKACEIDRWFFIRTATVDSQKFIRAATNFAESLEFEILTRAATEPLLRRIKLNSFV